VYLAWTDLAMLINSMSAEIHTVMMKRPEKLLKVRGAESVLGMP
jgi:hypothetical protein